MTRKHLAPALTALAASLALVACGTTPQAPAPRPTATAAPGAAAHALTAPAAAATASTRGYRYMHGPKNGLNPARWNKCEPIVYRINTRGMPARFDRDISGAFQRLSAATGIRFTKGADIRLTPYASDTWYERLPLGHGSNTIVIGFATDTQVPILTGNAVAYGGPIVDIYETQDPEIVAGGVIVERNLPFAHGFGTGSTPRFGTMLLHELGHVMNLGHVNDPAQLMHPTLRPDRAGEFGTGDLAGLRRLANLPCLNN